MRLAPETTMLGGYEIPKDVSSLDFLCKTQANKQTVVSAWTSELHRDPRIWPDPEAFVPERWLGDYKGVAADRKAFMPFSAGSRNCIGQQ